MKGFKEMAFVYFNPNPTGKHTGDCIISALCKALDQSWEETFMDLAKVGLSIYETIESNPTWDLYLRERGFSRHVIPDTCPNCYTVADFAEDFPYGTYVLGTGNHAICIEDGIIFGTWNPSREIPIVYYQMEA